MNEWFFGNLVKPNPPLRGARSTDMKDKNARKRLSDLKFLMEKVEKILRDGGKYLVDPTQLQVSAMYSYAVEKLLLPDTTRKKNGSDCSVKGKEWTSLVTLLRNSYPTRRTSTRYARRHRQNQSLDQEDVDSVEADSAVDNPLQPPRKQQRQLELDGEEGDLEHQNEASTRMH